MMRRSISFIAMAVTVGSASVLASERDALQSTAYREDFQRRWPHEGKPLRFKAPPSQLLDPWRCGVGNAYARPPSAASCGYDPRLASDFLLDYPFAGVRLMPPLRYAPAPGLTGKPAAGEPMPGAPPSQLPRIIEPANQSFIFLER